MNLGTLALLANEAESELVESETVVPWPGWAYGVITLVLLFSLLLMVTRLDLDR